MMFGVSLAGGKNSIFDLRLVENCLCALRLRVYPTLDACFGDFEARLRQTALLRLGDIIDEPSVLVGFIVWCVRCQWF